MNLYKLITCILLNVLFIACHNSNSKQIEQHFAHSKDSLCMQAYSFLCKNISNDELQSLASSKELFINNIEQAVNICRTQINNGEIPFSIFCEYVLPFRIFQEPMTNWRGECLEEFSFLKNKDSWYICNTINNLLKKGFKFGKQAPIYTSMTWNEVKESPSGHCYHMAKAPIFPLRALGVPVTIDFIYNWGNATGSHCWNVAYLHGKMIPFMGREGNPGTYNPFLAHENAPDSTKSAFRYPAKIYRKTFSINSELLQLRKGLPFSDMPLFLTDCRVTDVTSEYFPVTNIVLKDTIDNGNDLIYLATFSNDWQVTAVANTTNKTPIIFHNMKRNMLYIPALYKDERTMPFAPPFIIDNAGMMKELKPDHQSKNNLTIKFLYPLLMEYLYAWGHLDNLPKDIFEGLPLNKYRRGPENNVNYVLYYWNDNEWQSLDEKSASKNTIQFNNIPSNALFQIADKNGNFIGRCFTVDNGNMTWW